MTDKFIFRFVTVVTVVVILLVLVLNRHLIPGPAVAPAFTPYLPMLNAILNGTCTVLLLTSLYFIKQGNITVHKRLNILTFCLSTLFLVSYVLFHYLMRNETVYGDVNGDGKVLGDEITQFGTMRKIYLAILYLRQVYYR
jgi:putative membrane protein